MYRRLVAFLTVATAVAVGNLYYSQPLLPAMGAAFGVSQRSAGMISAITQLGYGVGLLSLVPLGDVVDRRRLIIFLCVAVAFALTGVWLAPTFPLLLLSSFAVGVLTVVPQVAIPLATAVAPPDARGRVVGTVMGGLLVGVLLSRTWAGFVGAHFGWRVIYMVASALMVLLALLVRTLLPRQPPLSRQRLSALFLSLFTLVIRQPLLRRHALLGSLAFAAFSAFWTTIAFHLAALPRHYGPDVAGLFGLLGVAGAMTAPLVGRRVDRMDPRVLNALGLGLMALGFVLLAALGRSLAGLALGVFILDVGLMANHITNQSLIFGLDAQMRSRINTVYMVTYFGGGAAGSTLALRAWAQWGWPGVTGLGLLLVCLAYLVFALVASPRTMAVRES